MLEIGTNSTEVGDRIIVVGVGDAGNRSVNRMIDEGIEDMEFIGVDTDNSVLQYCNAPVRLQIGGRHIGGLMKTSPKMGEKAAEKSAEDISAALRGAYMVFVICSMGGNAETGAAPVIARLAKDMGILTVGIVTTPFSFEGKECLACARRGVRYMEAYVNTLIVFEGDRLLQSVDKDVSKSDAFGEMHRALLQTVHGIRDMVYEYCNISLDLIDLEMVMRPKGMAHVGFGAGQGRKKILDAVRMATEGFGCTVSAADIAHVIIYVSGDVTLTDVDYALDHVRKIAGEEVNILWGLRFDYSEADRCTVMVIVKILNEGCYE